MFNQIPSPVLYNPQKTNFNPISEIKTHTIQHNNQTDPPHRKACISPTLETKNLESSRKSTYCSVDEFIDELLEGQETIISSDICKKFDALTFLKVEYKSRNLPPIELYKFSRDPAKCPEFIESFSKYVYFKTKYVHFRLPKNGVTPQRFRRGSKKDGSVYWAKWYILSNSIEMSKTRLWKANNCFIFKTKGIAPSTTVASKNKPAIRSFQQQLKATVIWLFSMGYHSVVRFTENISKVVTR